MKTLGLKKMKECRLARESKGEKTPSRRTTRSHERTCWPLLSTFILPILFLILPVHADAAGRIVYPWKAVPTIVKTGGSFEVWLDAAPGLTVESAQLRGPHHTLRLAEFTSESGTWTYDPISGNTYNTRLTASVPAGTPADRYDLVLNTSAGSVESIRAVSVIPGYKSEYRILHLSDSHLRDGVNHRDGLLEKKHTAIIRMANIINPELVFVTGDNIMYGRNFQQRADIFYLGSEEHGFKGMRHFDAPCFVVSGNHDHGPEPYEGHYEEKSRFWNQYHGLQFHGFDYGNSRFMLFSNAWVNCDWSWQRKWFDDWLENDGAGGNLRVAVAHLAAAGPLGRFVNRNRVGLVLVGHNHHLGDRNPWKMDDRLILYYARAVREYHEFNLYSVDDRTGTVTALGMVNTNEDSDGHGLPTGICKVLANNELRNEPDTSRWELNLTLEHAKPNDGSSPENTATFSNRFDFEIPEARVRFVMPKGADYVVSAGTIAQSFDGDAVRVIDVDVDLPPNQTTTLHIAPK